MEIPTQKEIADAKALLKKAGCYTDNLWSIEDVQGKFKCTNEEAQIVLDKALNNEETMEQIWFAIDFHGGDADLEKVENNEE
jgi:hypothetical protein